jgi:hypothetical protein
MAAASESGTPMNSPGQLSSTPGCQGDSGDSWSNPRAIAPSGEKTIEYSSPPPLRMNASSSVGDRCASKPKYRYSASGLSTASSIASARLTLRTSSMSANRSITS